MSKVSLITLPTHKGLNGAFGNLCLSFSSQFQGGHMSKNDDTNLLKLFLFMWFDNAERVGCSAIILTALTSILAEVQYFIKVGQTPDGGKREDEEG